MGFSTNLSADKSEVTFLIDGRFDFNMHSEFRNAYKDLGSSTSFIIDFRETTFMDSSAMGMLLLLREYAGDKSADIIFKNCNADMLKILSVSKLDKLFDIA